MLADKRKTNLLFICGHLRNLRLNLFAFPLCPPVRQWNRFCLVNWKEFTLEWPVSHVAGRAWDWSDSTREAPAREGKASAAKARAVALSEPNSASLHQVGAANPSKRTKPAPAVKQRVKAGGKPSTCSRWAPRGQRGRRVPKDEAGNARDLAVGGVSPSRPTGIHNHRTKAARSRMGP